MLKAGDKIDHYEVVRLLGKGGMGEVYLARDSVLERNVALKFLPDELESDARMKERFIREAKSAAALDHPFICKIYETGTHAGKAFIAMEYVEGETLKDRMEREPVPLRDAVRYCVEVGEALENAHRAGIVHRDLKPANIMISHQGHTKVMDFGLAKHIVPQGDLGGLTRTISQQSITEQGAIAGTIAYMSPEQARGDAIDARSDIFSLGIILCEMLEGKNPFSKATPIETLTSILRDAAPATHVTPRSVNPILNPIVHKALAKDPGERYPTIGGLVADLKEAQREIAGGGRSFARLLPYIGAAAAVVGLAVFAIVKLAGRGPAGEAAAGPKAVSVIIADAANRTGDPMLDGVLEQLLGISLGGAENVSVYERKQAVGLLDRIDPDAGGRLTETAARLLARREGINAVVDASIEPAAAGFLVKARAAEPVEGRTLALADQTIRNKADILKAADQLSAKLRAGLGVIPEGSSEALIKETFTTASLEAMKAYAEAQELEARGNAEDAVAAYLRAIGHDPDFGRAYAGLAVAYYAQGELQLADRYFKEALDRIDQMTDREKHRTRGGYYLFKSNFKRAIEEYAALLKIFPRDIAGHTNLAMAYFLGYRMREAFEEGLKACEAEPDNMDHRYNQSWYALVSGDFERAKLEARKTLEIKPGYPKAFIVLALVEIAQGRAEEAVKHYANAAAQGALGASFAATGLADLALCEGRVADAVGILTKGIAADEENKSGYRAADKSLMLARAFLAQGKKAQAAEASDRALASNKREEMMFAAGLIYIEAGREDKARSMAEELGKRVQDVHIAYGKLLGGHLALDKGDTAGALKLFDEAQGLVDTWLGRFALGRAYLEAGAFTEALSEFEKCQKRRGEAMSVFLINDLPTVRYLDPLDYCVGRALEGRGKAAAAKDAYAMFLKTKDKADPGQPMVEDAKRRLVSL